jgi:hypothetical protein
MGSWRTVGEVNMSRGIGRTGVAGMTVGAYSAPPDCGSEPCTIILGCVEHADMSALPRHGSLIGAGTAVCERKDTLDHRPELSRQRVPAVFAIAQTKAAIAGAILAVRP